MLGTARLVHIASAGTCQATPVTQFGKRQQETKQKAWMSLASMVSQMVAAHGSMAITYQAHACI